MDLVFAIQHKEIINRMDEVVSLRMSHGVVLSMGPITRKQTTTTTKKGDHRDGMRHMFVCRALTFVKRLVFSAGTPTFLFSSCRR